MITITILQKHFKNVKTKSLIVLCLVCVVMLVLFSPKFPKYPVLLEWNTKLIFSSKTNETFKKPLHIVLWLNPSLGINGLKYRLKFVLERIIIPQNTRNFCFKRNQKCVITLNWDNKTLEDADAIVFIEFAHAFTMKDLPPNWQQWRRQNQIWAVLIEESPINHGQILPPVFNWTISYRRDSNIWSPYGRIYAKNKASREILMGPEKNVKLSKWISGKSKLVTSAISNCHTNSRRENIVKKIIDTGKQIDIYGSCGNMKSEKTCGYYSRNCGDFWNKLAAEYKFYLAFENSICQDYITEKFWRSLKLGMVPVVYGGGDYENIAPPGSYIDVNDFKSAQHLINYLEWLAENETEYAKFFEWRQTFDIVKEDKASDLVWCQLCRKLRDLKNKQEKGSKLVYQVPTNWWSSSENGSEFLCTSFDKFVKWK